MRQDSQKIGNVDHNIGTVSKSSRTPSKMISYQQRSMDEFNVHNDPQIPLNQFDYYQLQNNDGQCFSHRYNPQQQPSDQRIVRRFNSSFPRSSDPASRFMHSDYLLQTNPSQRVVGTQENGFQSLPGRQYNFNPAQEMNSFQVKAPNDNQNYAQQSSIHPFDPSFLSGSGSGLTPFQTSSRQQVFNQPPTNNFYPGLPHNYENHSKRPSEFGHGLTELHEDEPLYLRRPTPKRRVTPLGLKAELCKTVESSAKACGVGLNNSAQLNTAVTESNEVTGESGIAKQAHKKFLITANRFYLGSSKYKGVCWNKKKKKWRARISNNGKREFLGDWDSEAKAAMIYDARVKQLYGDNQILKERLNFPDGVECLLQTVNNNLMDRTISEKQK